tara:strand:- start:1838 stop:2407 length:570 start_codon:yes stop_codon:yes gene_type:complete
MVNNDYLVDMSWCDSGGYCDFMPIRGENNLGFKSFKTKKRALESIDNQLKLAEFDLAPRIVTDLCKIPYSYDPELLKHWNPNETVTSWGYVTEKAMLVDVDDTPYNKLQSLVDNVRDKTGLKFWDCHWTNIGYIKRGRRELLVCIDTGAESFTPYCNAWGYEEPGPKCPYCDEYQCYCSVVLPHEDCIR